MAMYPVRNRPDDGTRTKTWRFIKNNNGRRCWIEVCIGEGEIRVENMTQAVKDTKSTGTQKSEASTVKYEKLQ